MKKITIMAALLMGGYMANAQVGIGTPEPHESAELDIVAKSGNRGILIPRVMLTNETTFGMAGAAAGAESLLVYHLGSENSSDSGADDDGTKASTGMAKGFYYWSDSKWNKIVAGADLSDNLVTMQEDMSDVRDLLNYIAPSNPGNLGTDGSQKGTEVNHSTVVFDAATEKLKIVTYDATTKAYKSADINFETMVANTETETLLLEVAATTDAGKQFVYFSEDVVKEWLKANEGGDTKNIPVENGVTIDIVGEMKTSQAVFFKDSAVIDAIKEISLKADGNVIYKNIAAEGEEANFVIQYFEGGVSKSVTFGELVAASEVTTTILPIMTSDKVVGYRYYNEDAVKNLNGTPTVIGEDDVSKGAIDINVVDDVVGSFGEILASSSKEKKSEDSVYKVNELISRYMDSLGNVYFGDVGGEEILFTVDAIGTKSPVNLEFITTAIKDQIVEVQEVLGEKLEENGEPIKTGDSFKGDSVLKHMGTTVIDKNKSITSGITVGGGDDVKQVLGIELFRNGLFVTSAVTDIKINGKKISFNIGTGNVYYNITDPEAANTTFDVVVKYAIATPTP